MVVLERILQAQLGEPTVAPVVPVFVLVVLLWFECGNWGFLLAVLGPDCIRAYPFFGVFGWSVLSLFCVVSSQAGGHAGPPLRFFVGGSVVDWILWNGGWGSRGSVGNFAGVWRV